MSEAEIASTNAAADQNRDELVERLKAELADEDGGRGAGQRAHGRVRGQGARQNLGVAGGRQVLHVRVRQRGDRRAPPGPLKDDVAPLGNWAATYHEKADIASQGALAAVSYVASKGIKRLREQASQGAAAPETLAETMKANEELTAQNSQAAEGLRRGSSDLCDERQKGLETLQAELVKGGLMNEKFNFSKLASREQVDEPHAASRQRGGHALARGRQGRGVQGGRRARRATRSSSRTCLRRCSAAAGQPAHEPQRHQPRAPRAPSAARPTSLASSAAPPVGPTSFRRRRALQAVRNRPPALQPPRSVAHPPCSTGSFE